MAAGLLTSRLTDQNSEEDRRMNNAQKESGLLIQTWKFFASVRLTITLLVFIAVFSIIGTLIPQNADPEMYLHSFGESVFRLFSILDIFDIYHSWLFQFLIIMLAVNIIVCSFERLSATWKIIFVKIPKFSLSRFQKSLNQEEFKVSQPIEILKNEYESFVTRHFRYKTVEQTDSGVRIFAEKWRWTRLGVYVVHLSVVLLLVGALVGSIAGFDGFANIPEGETTDHIRLWNSKGVMPIDFEIRCDDFHVSFYDTGAPKEFRSALSILENGKVVLQKDIIVNDPLRYRGVSFFQSSYGRLHPKNITLNFTRKSTGKSVRQKVQMDEIIALPEDMGQFVIRDFDPDYQFMGHRTGGAFLGTMTLKNGQVVDTIIPFPFPEVDIKNPMENRLLSMLQTGRNTDIPEVIRVNFTIQKTGKTFTLKGAVGKEMVLPDRMGKFLMTAFMPSYDFRGHNLGDTFIGTLTPLNGEPQDVILPLRFSQFDKMRQGEVMISIDDFQRKTVSTDLIVSVTEFEEKYYTVLGVTKDPGVWIVYTGFIVMIIGIYITFFMSHQQICIDMTEKKKQTMVRVAGVADRNKLGMQNRVRQIAKHLNKLIS